MTWLLTVERSGPSINLVVSDLRNPTERYEYEGMVVGDLVNAEIENYSVGADGAEDESRLPMNPIFRAASLRMAVRLRRK
jgi:hypothetical protein